MTESNDPKGYYRALGLAPNASQAQIDHAYREWAKRYHPDVKGSGNSAEFIRIKEAHDILGDPMRRAQYDRSGFDASRQSSPWGEPPGGQTNQAYRPVRIEAIKCVACGAITAQPRFCVFYRVWSAIYYTRMEKPSGVYCSHCARRRSVRHSVFTWLLGWWSGYGILWTPLALWKNFNIGEQPKQANARLLIHQGLFFVQEGHVDAANACFEQAKRFAQSEELDAIELLRKDMPSGTPRALRDQWTWDPMTVGLHLTPVFLIVCAVIVLLSPALVTRARTATNTPIDIRYVVISSLTAWVPSSNGYAVAETLSEYTTLRIIRQSPNPKFVVASAPDGRIVTVAASALMPGNGQQAKLRWCRANSGPKPVNNDIFKSSLRGPNRVTVKNLGDTDAVVQFRAIDGTIALSFFVAANSTATVNHFPDGDFRLEFATGNNWSQACNLFVDDMAIGRFPDCDVFQSTETTYRVADYTITPVEGGNVRVIPMNLGAFEQGN